VRRRTSPDDTLGGPCPTALEDLRPGIIPHGDKRTGTFPDNVPDAAAGWISGKFDPGEKLSILSMNK
jgi:hypothetical protein